MVKIKEITEDEFEELRHQFDKYFYIVGFIYNSTNENLVAFRHIEEGIFHYYKIC